MTMHEHLKYVDEQDKSYGIAGMAVSLVISEADDIIREISLDGEDDAISFSPEFHFSGNPRFSARTIFNDNVKYFQLSIGMMMSNVICRSYALKGRGVTSEVVRELRFIAREEGLKSCSLDDDEVDVLFNKSYNYFESLFSNKAVQNLVDKFAKTLKENRHLSSDEIIDILGQLNQVY